MRGYQITGPTTVTVLVEDVDRATDSQIVTFAARVAFRPVVSARMSRDTNDKTRAVVTLERS